MTLVVALAAQSVSADPARAAIDCRVSGACCFPPSTRTDPLKRLRSSVRHRAIVGLPKVEVREDAALSFPTIKRVIRRSSAELAACYPRRLPASVGDGRVGLALAIMPTGKVELVGAMGFDAEVASCMADVIARIRFPANDGVTHTFVPIRIEGQLARVSPAR